MTKLAELNKWLDRIYTAPSSEAFVQTFKMKVKDLLAEEQAVPVKDVGEAGLRDDILHIVSLTEMEGRVRKLRGRITACFSKHPTPAPVASGLEQGLEDIDWMACQAMKEYDGVDIARVPKVYHGYRTILAKVDGLKNMLSHATPSSQAEKVDGGLWESLKNLESMLKTSINPTWRSAGEELEIVLSRHTPLPTKEEPLACLADRKGTMIDGIGARKDGIWFILVNGKRFCGINWEFAEEQARQYLNGLNDAEKGGGK